MLFDVQAALAEILADHAATTATPATNSPNVAIVAGVATYQVSISEPAPTSSWDCNPPGTIIHLSRYTPKPNPEGRPVRALPTQPATCALCGRADWTVAMVDMQGRALHVSCWKAEGGAA